MCTAQENNNYSTRVSDSFDPISPNLQFEVPFRRWLVREIEEGRMRVSDAVLRFKFHPVNGATMIHKWRLKYGPEMVLALPAMTELEKQEVAKLKENLQEKEQQLDKAIMANIALNKLIDVAEEMLHISIRKKPGTKQ